MTDSRSSRWHIENPAQGMNKNLKLFQIFYNDETRQQLDPGFIALDNRANTRPDWAEYWPIRQVLLNNQFSDNDYIGFFSPRFYEKTGCNSEQVKDVVTNGGDEIFSFSPFFDHSALHLNPFEQGERYHPGLITSFESLSGELDIELNPREIVCDHTTTIFSNYFVASYEIWKRWLAMTEIIFRICEENITPLGQKMQACL
ncbi:hypothetical protein [Solemya elarraichensis gill symbiont]|uniref:Uncharacterized protein n=1 Tax=Solemya elarraichensis gill symbiont TaxID=1918949 RepID=A0A1T2L0H4_9GAMM|nr:hypothetical protein [Solemya elarraichensis gill symbiont]OOZ38564.1 hypothetical protein BOW52_08315 [Solemya elarraichensis gill symbiont]